MKKLYIKSSLGGDLPELRDIVAHLPFALWSVLRASGIRDGNSAPSEWTCIQDSPVGLLLNSEELVEFDTGHGDGDTCLMDAVIIGYKDPEFFKKFATKEKMLANADIVLDLTDGHSWLIEANDYTILDKLALHLGSFCTQFISSDGTVT